MTNLKRRRKEYRTDYKKRFALLKSGLPRIIFRKTNRYLIAQYVKSKEAQDSAVLGVNSKELLKYGWPEKESIKSIPASYLTGYLFGKKILLKKLERPILDLGMARALHKTKVYAFIKGLTDSGIKIECAKENFPDETRIRGEHLKNKISFDEIKSKIDKK
ncbi:50S ribosomal protein L18 [Candidatus Pacearchaeota archaeon]|nr:50S ribosomal protein L18 [Candidatus Pacearchaeota archaeon]MBI2057011.1 50S ribosomal protein L18 [Candidatus Pacearchaeota archaeon]